MVGTTSIEKSEIISKILTNAKIPHQVLNARYHEQEAQIIANAGVSGAVTIATNMAGRGTDIQLGGNVEMRVNLALEKENQNKDPLDDNTNLSINMPHNKNTKTLINKAKKITKIIEEIKLLK